MSALWNRQSVTEAIKAGLEASMVKPLLADSESLPYLLEFFRDTALRHLELLQYCFSNPRKIEVCQTEISMEDFQSTPSFSGAQEISNERARTSFRRAIANARGKITENVRPKEKPRKGSNTETSQNPPTLQVL